MQQNRNKLFKAIKQLFPFVDNKFKCVSSAVRIKIGYIFGYLMFHITLMTPNLLINCQPDKAQNNNKHRE